MAGGEPEELPVDADASAPSLPLTAFLRRAGRWSGVAAQFFSVHAVVQAAMLASGLLFAHLLPVAAFAAYALATSILVAFTFCTDLGVSVALNYFHRASLTGGRPYAEVLHAALRLRRRLFAMGTPVVAVATWWWGERVGAGVWPTVGMLGLILAVTWWQVLATTRVTDLRLRQKFGAAYRAEVLGALVRLGAVAGILAAGLRDAWSAVAAALTAAVTTALSAAPPQRLREERASPEAQSELVRYLLPTLPSALYFAVQGQAMVWLAAAFGGVSTLAGVGALGRLGLVVSAFGGLTTVVFVPRLARLADDRMFLRRFLQFLTVLVGIAAVLQTVAMVVPGVLLWLIGPAYRSLAAEMQLMVLASGLTLVAAFLVQVNHLRAWSRWQPVALGALVVSQALMAMALPLATTEGVMWFTVGSAAVGGVSQAVITACGFLQPSWVQWRVSE